MAKKYKVIVTPQAQQQLTAIKDYILLELKSPIAAKNTLSALKIILPTDISVQKAVQIYVNIY